MNKITGKVAIITGSTQGLGAAIAHLFAEAGAAGIVTCGRRPDNGKEVVDSINEKFGTPVHFVKSDLGNTDDVRKIVKEAEEVFGRIDIVVNAAGLTDRGTILNTSEDLFNDMFATNVRAPFFLMQESIKVMIKQDIQGSIVNIGSTSERAGQPFISAYCASKGALATLTRNTGYAVMRNRIRVNQLDIGWMNSDHERKIQAEESGDPEFIDKQAALLPFGRLLEPSEVAKAVLWIASEDSGMMTGSVIQFDQSVWGGYDGQAPVPELRIEDL
jgi:NAD(P)-dependent dehydrogenase (short-subunit alcohol dehydrogenase family)